VTQLGENYRTDSENIVSIEFGEWNNPENDDFLWFDYMQLIVDVVENKEGGDLNSMLGRVELVSQCK
jgi:predicted KAP-like P-loop ATPase